jgi:hypothetical protein
LRKVSSDYSAYIDPKRELTEEVLRAQRREFLMKNYSDLCELRVSAVK